MTYGDGVSDTTTVGRFGTVGEREFGISAWYFVVTDAAAVYPRGSTVAPIGTLVVGEAVAAGKGVVWRSR